MANSHIYFYMSNAITSASLPNVDGGSNGSLVSPDLNTSSASGGYLDFLLRENGRYTLYLSGSSHNGFKKVKLDSGFDVADSDEFLEVDNNGNPSPSGIKLSTDGTLSDNSDLFLPSEKAVKTYIDALESEYQSSSYEKGASKIGIYDTNSYYTATDVEGVLKESYENLLNLLYDPSGDTPGLTFGKETDNTVEVQSSAIASNDNKVIGNYAFEYEFDNNDSVLGSYSGSIVSRSSNLIINKPENGDSVYDEDCYFHARVRFEGVGGNSNWSIENRTTITEPGSTLTDEGIVDVLASGNTSAESVIRSIANYIADNSVVGRMVAENMKTAFISGEGAPAISADFIGQWYFDTDGENWHRSINVGVDPASDDWKKTT